MTEIPASAPATPAAAAAASGRIPAPAGQIAPAEQKAPRTEDGTARPVTPGSQAAEGTYRNQPVSFVRRGTRLQGRRQKAWDDHSATLAVDVPRHISDTSVHPDYVFNAAQTFGRTAPLVVEIGSGLGDAVVHAAKENPDKDFLAVEVYTPGLAQTIQKIVAAGLDNVRVVQANAPEVLSTMLPAGSVSEVWVFFPDPWHKTKHNKRRMVKDSFAPLAARVLAPGGLWRLATDWSTYAEQMRGVGAASPDFENVHDGERAGSESPLTQARLTGVDCEASNEPDSAGGWAPRFDGRVLTSFENKAHKAGRAIFDLTLRRS
ncbi:tRNA (guanosine(46)-N7)-methyltransferase TrmB [Arthrobacter livingstonensis]|uniref:tRNA (guanine-N(7)-)-methyltransferase n=1 Tax=Arthrobacter livingstonensis TaxID=670078 RepID=A0A2V5L389_9MICC|nr:tRNA (guanosine(46)-N7)-methyltransferase TrmB [Arthrobacter livingstonensis]PYI65578.1 tRNA (guanosine(46)-N7)-methyltransferase TrmB [Arthrobacter livingstonensis]